MEDTAKRPGGLTAMAVINFVLGGFLLLSLLGFIGGKYAYNMAENQRAQEQQTADPNAAPSNQYTPEQQQQMETARKVFADPTIRILTYLNVVPCALLIVSGIGYLRLKKMLGRMMGNLYALVSIVLGIAEIVLIDKDLGGGFGIASLIGFIYPALTLFLMNVTFKDDLVE
ncbi:MAG: hypothetical protein JW810_05905 [Sedimentisphaerales bacterium]|nr:hypothetical protein [Sedimentisphaerales bacterium]